MEAFVPWKRKTLQKDHAENVQGAEEETTGNRKKRMSTVQKASRVAVSAPGAARNLSKCKAVKKISSGTCKKEGMDSADGDGMQESKAGRDKGSHKGRKWKPRASHCLPQKDCVNVNKTSLSALFERNFLMLFQRIQILITRNRYPHNLKENCA